MTPERVLVTGASGFIGAHLCRRLVAEGHSVVGFDDFSESSPGSLSDVPQVELIEADLRDSAAVAAAARGCAVIYHQGAKRSVPRSMDEPGLFASVNVVGTLNVLLAARDSDAIVVSASSSSVYGDQEMFPSVETMSPMPRSPYAASKLAAEIYCASLWRSHRIPAVSLRYFNVYGPGQSPESEYAAVVPKFVIACLDGTRPVIHGDGEQARDFTFIDDVVEANLRAARAPDRAFGLAFNIGGGAEPTSVNRLLGLIAAHCGAGPQPVFEPSRAGDVRITDANISLAHELFGYEPSVAIDEGLGRTVQALRASSSSGVAR